MSFCAETEKYKITSIILLKSGKISVVLRPAQDVDFLAVRRNPGRSPFSLAKNDILVAANGKDHGRISSENASLQYGYHWGKKTIQKYGRERNLPIGRKN